MDTGIEALPVDAAAVMPSDASLAALERATDLIRAGGPVVMILLGLAVIALAVMLLKLWQFSSYRLFDRKPINQALEAVRTEHISKAMERIAHHRNPISEILLLAIRGKRQAVPEAELREMLQCAAADRLEGLRSYFRVLEVIASLAPLLGLLGTVLGMIEAFRALESAGTQVDPAILSGGIWEALLTTAVGLSIAIPVVALLNWFERRVDRVAHEMGRAVTTVFTQAAIQHMGTHQDAGNTIARAAVAGR